MSTDRVKTVAKEEATKAKDLTVQAVQSKAYFYPLKGIYFLTTHRALWEPLKDKFLPTIGIGLVILVCTFATLYIPLMAIMVFTNGPIAPIAAGATCLEISSTLFSTVAKSFYLGDALVDEFDATLLLLHHDALVSNGRTIKPGSDAMNKLGKLVRRPFAKYSPNAIIRSLMYMALNLIPGVGIVLSIFLQGKSLGPSAHARYFQLKGMDSRRKEEFVKDRAGAYTSFGITALALEMIPFAGVFFAFTNAVAAALWASDLEAKTGTSPELRKQAEKEL